MVVVLSLIGSVNGDFNDILNVSLCDSTFFVLSDLGAWHGLAAPCFSQSKNVLPPAIAGPFIHGGEGLIAESLFQLQLSVAGQPVHPLGGGAVLTPGNLASNATYNGGLVATISTVFISNRTAALQVNISNQGTTPATLSWAIVGTVDIAKSPHVAAAGSAVTVAFDASGAMVVVQFDSSALAGLSVAGNAYTARFGPAAVAPGQHVLAHATMAFVFSPAEAAAASSLSTQFFQSPFGYLQSAAARWSDLVAKATSGVPPTLERLAVKALMTLMTNWRGASGAYLHDGLYPSFRNYAGFWAWDSWKHARALALVAPALALSQARQHIS